MQIIQILGVVLSFTWTAGIITDFRTHQLKGKVLWFYIVTGLVLNVLIWGPFLL